MSTVSHGNLHHYVRHYNPIISRYHYHRYYNIIVVESKVCPLEILLQRNHLGLTDYLNLYYFFHPVSSSKISFNPNIVFNALHGQFVEYWYIQTVLESQKVKYTHSGVLASSIAMDKEISKKMFIKNKILTPKYIKFNFNKNNKIDKKLIFKIQKKLKFI